MRVLAAFALLYVLTAVAAAQQGGEARLPAGTFTMGTDEARVDALMARFGSRRREIFASELPAQPVKVQSFFIDRVAS